MTTASPMPYTLAQSAGRVDKESFDANIIARDTIARAKEKHALNAFVVLPSDEIFDQAAHANAMRARAEHTPLTGAPIAIADNIVTAWGRTEAGSAMLRGYESPFHATVIEHLLDAGALIFGKTNVAELGVGITTQASRHGVTRNPVCLSHIVGGTAAGSAAAVGAYVVPAALAVDTVGGARIAAAHTSTIALRPTYGAVSRHGIIAYASSMDVVTILGHTISDIAAIYDSISAHDPKDGTSTPAPRVHTARALDAPAQGLRVGVVKELMDLPMDEATRRAVEYAMERLREQGCEVIEVSLPTADRMSHVASIIAAAEASTNFARYDGVRFGHRANDVQSIEALYEQSRAEGLGPDIIHTILLGTQMMYRDNYKTHFQRAQRIRHRVALEYKRVFENVDVLLGPTAADPAPTADCLPPTPQKAAYATRFTAGEALAGLPAITLPAGRCPDGLPIAIQLTANRHHEATLLGAAHTLQMWQSSAEESKS